VSRPPGPFPCHAQGDAQGEPDAQGDAQGEPDAQGDAQGEPDAQGDAQGEPDAQGDAQGDRQGALSGNALAGKKRWPMSSPAAKGRRGYSLDHTCILTDTVGQRPPDPRATRS
jgi:hypothetical protein